MKTKITFTTFLVITAVFVTMFWLPMQEHIRNPQQLLSITRLKLQSALNPHDQQQQKLRISASKQVCIKGAPMFDQRFLHDQLRPFLSVYDARPGVSNNGGTRVMHQFALWCWIRNLQPRYIIESGVLRGLATWLLRQAAPQAKLVLLDPSKSYRLNYRDQKYDTVYLTGHNFTDFADVNWTSIVDPAQTLVFMDDHHNPIRRILDAKRHGFKHIIFDDNYWLGEGDLTSLKLMCEMLLGHMTLHGIVYKDRHKKPNRPMTQQDLQAARDVFDNVIEQYYEFPMMWNSSEVITNKDNRNFMFDVNSGYDLLRKFGLVKMPPPSEINGYYNIVYVKIK